MLDENGAPFSRPAPRSRWRSKGLSDVPGAGEDFMALADERKAREIGAVPPGQVPRREAREEACREAGESVREHGRRRGEIASAAIRRTCRLAGSADPRARRLSTEEVKVNVVHAAVGAITESDVNLALASKAVIIGFKHARRCDRTQSAELRA